MVQPNTEARPRRSRTRRGEEQAPLVDSQLSTTNDVIMDGEENTCHTCCIHVAGHLKLHRLSISHS